VPHAALDFVPNNTGLSPRIALECAQAIEQASEFHGDAGNSSRHAA
jgi:hypothetical protein